MSDLNNQINDCRFEIGYYYEQILELKLPLDIKFEILDKLSVDMAHALSMANRFIGGGME